MESNKIFQSSLAKSIFENGVLALVVALLVAIAGYLFDLSKEYKTLELQVRKEQRDTRLKILEEKLARFYVPMYFRLQQDSAIWTRLKKLYAKADTPFPAQLEDIIERDCLLKNHEAMVEIIQNNSYLIGNDQRLQSVLIQYVRHVAVYEALRASPTYNKRNPVDFKEPYPNALNLLIAENLHRVQAEYQALLNETRIRQ